MRKPLLLFTAFLTALLPSLPARAQGPMLDPGFLPAQVWDLAHVGQLQEQADGKRVFSTSSDGKVNDTRVPGLARLLPNSDQVDLSFQTNVAGLRAASALVVTVLPGNKLLLSNAGAISLGGVSRQRLLRLNADGTPDPAFDADAALAGLPGGTPVVLAQPDGKVLVCGEFRSFSGPPVPYLARLETSGAVDQAFAANLGTGFSGPVRRLLVQADGRIVATGGFSLFNGQAYPGLLRLLPTGALDAAFQPQLPSWAQVVGLDQQPDGKLLVASTDHDRSLFDNSWRPLERLLPTDGRRDLAFQTGTNFSEPFAHVPYSNGSPVRALPGGGILALPQPGTYNGTPVGNLVRLTDAGALDPTFPNATALPNYPSYPAIAELRLTGNGQQVLINSQPVRYALGEVPRTLALVDAATGQRVTSFAPRILKQGQVWDVARQPDGKLVLGGEFVEVNDAPAAYLARLLPNGQFDPTFTAQTDNFIRAVAVQPDGRVVAGGYFNYAGGQLRPGVARFLPNGTLDMSFAPRFPAHQSLADRIAVQPNGNVLAVGNFSYRSTGGGTRIESLLGSTGAPDPAFQLGFSPSGREKILVQSDGKIVFGSYLQYIGGQFANLWRTLSTGALDPSFTPVSGPDAGNHGVGAIGIDLATGNLYADVGPTVNSGNALRRLFSDGTPDPSFSVPPGTFGSFYQLFTLAVQPNGRLLLGGYFQTAAQTYVGSLRLLPTGQPDASYNAANGPEALVTKVLVQPDGALVMGGLFNIVSGLPVMGITRLLDPNVLSVGQQTAGAAKLEAWPVPAHGQLHLRTGTARPEKVELLDALGRVALTQPAYATELTLSTAALLPGTYVLRVHYANGRPVTRRVVLE